VGPLNGAKVVAKAWTNSQYRQRLLDDGTAAIKELGFSGRQGEHIVVVENTATTHNVVVCTLCSCYPWPVLGLPPGWYKDPAYRSRMVREPRRVLAEMGLELADDVQITVRDSTSEVRWLVLPQRPTGTEHLTEKELVPLVTRDAMVGVAKVEAP
jgi:nitrile hydratase